MTSSDPHQPGSGRQAELYVVLAGSVLYASRETLEEAERVARDDYDLAAMFGLPVRVERRVIPLRKAKGP